MNLNDFGITQKMYFHIHSSFLSKNAYIKMHIPTINNLGIYGKRQCLSPGNT